MDPVITENQDRFNITPIKIFGLIFLYTAIFVIAVLISIKIFGERATGSKEFEVSVIGEGIIKTESDKMVIPVNVIDYGSNYEKISSKNKERGRALEKLLIKAGIPKHDITISVGTQIPDGIDSINLPDSKDKLYQSYSYIKVNVDSLDLYDKVISIAEDFLKEEVPTNEIVYELKTPDLYLNKVKKLALENARDQIEEILKINNLKIIKESSASAKDRRGNFMVGKASSIWGTKVIVKDAYEVKYLLKSL